MFRLKPWLNVDLFVYISKKKKVFVYYIENRAFEKGREK